MSWSSTCLDDASLCLSGWCGAVLLRVPEPQLQHQQFPELVIIVAAAAVMFRQEILDKLRRDDAAIEKCRAGEMVPQETTQRTTEPYFQRHSESALGLIQQFGWQAVAQRPDEDILAPPIFHFPGMGNLRSQLGQFVIEHWAAHLQRVR